VQLVSEISKLCDHKSPTSQTDRQTDGRTTCDPKTAHMHLAYQQAVRRSGVSLFPEHVIGSAVVKITNRALRFVFQLCHESWLINALYFTLLYFTLPSLGGRPKSAGVM